MCRWSASSSLSEVVTRKLIILSPNNYIVGLLCVQSKPALFPFLYFQIPPSLTLCRYILSNCIVKKCKKVVGPTSTEWSLVVSSISPSSWIARSALNALKIRRREVDEAMGTCVFHSHSSSPSLIVPFYCWRARLPRAASDISLVICPFIARLVLRIVAAHRLLRY